MLRVLRTTARAADPNKEFWNCGDSIARPIMRFIVWT
jgi:hypothetical protein